MTIEVRIGAVGDAARHIAQLSAALLHSLGMAALGAKQRFGDKDASAKLPIIGNPKN